MAKLPEDMPHASMDILLGCPSPLRLDADPLCVCWRREAARPRSSCWLLMKRGNERYAYVRPFPGAEKREPGWRIKFGMIGFTRASMFAGVISAVLTLPRLTDPIWET